jgi:S1-C subfamily serine protease
MNEFPNEQQGDEPTESESSVHVPPVTSPADDPTITQQHPITQQVSHVQPPILPSATPVAYPGEPMAVAADDLYPVAAYPAPTSPWAPAPAPGTWGVAAAPGWGPGGPMPVPAPGGWGTGMGGAAPPTAWPPAPYGYYPAPPPPPTATKDHKGQVAVIASLVAVLALLLGATVGHATWPTAATPASSGSGLGLGPAAGSQFPFGTGGSGGSTANGSGNSTTGAGAPADVPGISSKISPALVDINTNLSYQNVQAAGTGIVLTSTGEILTNNHVIDGATSISVTDIGNGQTYKANVVGYDRTGDIAVIQTVGASGLQTAKIAPSPPAVGEGVVGVGNAGGAGGTPSSAGGSVTALNQAITASDSGGGNSENLSGLIEMNSNIQPGDSGGALVNAAGKVVGMDTAASTGSSGSGGAARAYAIPIGTALSVAKSIESGRASSTIHIGATGFLGIQVQDSSATGSATGSVGSGAKSSSGSSTTGAVIVGTLPGSPGATAGLTQGDIITGVDSSSVDVSSDLSRALESHHPGDVIHLQWSDQAGTSHTSSVILAIGPPA